MRVVSEGELFIFMDWKDSSFLLDLAPFWEGSRCVNLCFLLIFFHF